MKEVVLEFVESKNSRKKSWDLALDTMTVLHNSVRKLL